MALTVSKRRIEHDSARHLMQLHKGAKVLSVLPAPDGDLWIEIQQDTDAPMVYRYFRMQVHATLLGSANGLDVFDEGES